MATIATLNIALTATSKAFGKGLDFAQDKLGKFRKGLTKLDSTLGGVGKSLVGAFAAGKLISKFQETADALDKIGKTADKLGISVEKLQGLQFAAEQTGVSADTMNMAMQRMVRRVAEAAQGSGEAVNALKELGISAEKLAQLSPDEQMRQIADAMQGVAGQGDKVRLAMKLFDSEGVALVNTLAGGSAALDEYQRQLEETGAVMSREQIAKVEAANDAWNKASKTIDGAFRKALVAIAPAIESVGNAIGDLGKNWAKVLILAEAVGAKLTGNTKRLRELRAELEAIDKVGGAAGSKAAGAAGGGNVEEIEEIKISQEAWDRLEELNRAADRFRDMAETPAEKLDKEFRDLNEAFAEGLIDQRTFDRVEKQLQERAAKLAKDGYHTPMEKALGLDSLRAGSIERGSGAAFSRTNQNNQLFKSLGDNARIQTEKQTQMVAILERMEANGGGNLQVASLN